MKVLRLYTVLCLTIASVCWAHPTKYTDVKAFSFDEFQQDPENLPRFRSFHVHVMFQNEQNICNGYDKAMDLRSRFMKRFKIDSAPCFGDFDQARLCMFPTVHYSYGLFSSPQWSAFIPVTSFPEVSTWLVQHRGAFDVFVHPNTGFELNDHKDWSFWLGNPWTLNLGKLDISRNLPKIVNATCLPETSRRTMPKSKGRVVRLESAHVRFINLSRKEVKFTLSNEQQVPILGHLGSTWYFDVQPEHLKINLKALARYLEFTPELGTFYTVVNAENIMILLMDDNKVLSTHGKVRFVNLLPETKVDVVRNGLRVFQYLDHAAFEKRSYYDEVPESPDTKYSYKIFAAGTETLISTQTFFVTAGKTKTAFIVEAENSNQQRNLVMVQDYPYDSEPLF